jgi:hypothetical protein
MRSFDILFDTFFSLYGVYNLVLAVCNLLLGKHLLDIISEALLLMGKLRYGPALEKKMRQSMLEENRLKIKSLNYLLVGILSFVLVLS